MIKKTIVILLIVASLMMNGCSITHHKSYKAYADNHSIETTSKVAVIVKLLEMKIAALTDAPRSDVIDLGNGSKVIMVGRQDAVVREMEVLSKTILMLLDDLKLPGDDPLYKTIAAVIKPVAAVAGIYAVGGVLKNLAEATNNASSIVKDSYNDNSDKSKDTKVTKIDVDKSIEVTATDNSGQGNNRDNVKTDNTDAGDNRDNTSTDNTNSGDNRDNTNNAGAGDNRDNTDDNSDQSDNSNVTTKPIKEIQE